MPQDANTLCVLIGIDHHVQREALLRQVAHGIGLCAYVYTVKAQACSLGDVGRVGVTQHLEVVHLRQVVAGNSFREGNADVVADA